LIGIRNDFAYDDLFVVAANPVVKDIAHWWRIFGEPYWPRVFGADGYRPLTILAFSIQWAAAGGKPWLFHAVNITLCAASAVAVFYLARACLPVAAAWLCAALFAVHPVHVEAVANVVGQSELIVACLIIPAVTLYINGRNGDGLSVSRMAAILVLYALACLAKEHGIVLPALLLAAELTVVVDKAPIRERFVRLRPFVLSLTALGVAYLWLHQQVSSQVATGFHPYVPFTSNHLGTTQRWWTMFGLAPEWIRLLLWPQYLSSEYGPPAYPIVTAFAAYQVPGMLIIGAIVALMFVTRRRSPAASFGVAWTLLALLPTSNFIVPSGILMAERTLFLPSVGVVIAVGAVVPWIHARLKTTAAEATAAMVALALVLAGGWRTFHRTQVWKDNDTLFAQALVDAPYVYRSHFMMGAWQFTKKHLIEGEKEYRVALAMYDRDPYVWYSMGQEYMNYRMYKAAIPFFRKALEVDPTLSESRARLAAALAESGQWDEAWDQARLTMKTNASFNAMRVVMRLAAKKRREAAASRHGETSGSAGPVVAGSGKVPSGLQNATPKPPSEPRHNP
jgi:Tfp pilus assembly protein PilF